MAQEMKTDFFAFIARFNQLKAMWFSKQATPQYDPDNGEELPSAFDREALMTLFKNMGLIPPGTRKEGPRFMNPDAQAGFDNWRRSYEQENNLKLFD